MTRRFSLLVLIALASIPACTPLGENVVRRTGDDQRSDPSNLSQRTHQPSADAAPDLSTIRIISQYGPAIKEYANRYGFDWRLVLAVMKQESGFSTDAESQRGASGLMQVMPVTQREISDRLDLDDSTRPGTNIRIGVYYLSTLEGMFRGASDADRLKLTLASYNAGLGRVHDAQEIAAYLGDNPVRWESVKEALPLLSKRFASLHRHVWADERPRNGCFGGSRQTVAYVDSVITHYESYLRTLN